ncbi:MAG: hypothetical protein MH252_07170 [Thermosynechococcaceae cyanobacterium MS004]|nr:hypothetical protein [Thermosynechococcaceae cyanobacterium MS004]
MNAKQTEDQILTEEHLAFVNQVLSLTVLMSVIGLAIFGFTSSKVVQKENSSYWWVYVASFSFSMGGSSLVYIPYWLAKRDQVRKELEIKL